MDLDFLAFVTSLYHFIQFSFRPNIYSAWSLGTVGSCSVGDFEKYEAVSATTSTINRDRPDRIIAEYAECVFVITVSAEAHTGDPVIIDPCINPQIPSGTQKVE